MKPITVSRPSDEGTWFSDLLADLKVLRVKDAVREKLVAISPKSWEGYWKKEVLDFYGWNQKDDPEVYTKICENCHEAADFYDYSESIVDLLEPGPQDACFNVGCGAGRVEFHLAPKVKSIDSVDFSPSMVELAREKLKDYPNVRIHQNDGTTLRVLPDATFDLGWCELVFQHVPRDVTRGYLQEVLRVLKPGGRFICNIPRMARYGNTVTCGGFTGRQAHKMLTSIFPKVEYVEPDDANYYVVILSRLP